MEVFACLNNEHWTKTGPFSTIDLEKRIYEALGPHPHMSHIAESTSSANLSYNASPMARYART